MRNVFISYSHKEDQKYKDMLSRMSQRYGLFNDKSVELGEIDDNDSAERIAQIIREEYLGNTSVTVVLLGVNTGRRKHIDWEIGSSLRQSKKTGRRNGLVIIFMPEYVQKYGGLKYSKDWVGERIYDNIKNDYAECISWNKFINNPNSLKTAIEKAYSKSISDDYEPDNSASFRKNNGNWIY